MSLAALRQYGLVDYARRIELDCDLLPLHINDSPTFWYLKDMGQAASLCALASTGLLLLPRAYKARRSHRFVRHPWTRSSDEAIDVDIERISFRIPILDYQQLNKMTPVSHSTGSSPPHIRPASISTALPSEGASASLRVLVPDKTRVTRDPTRAIVIWSGYTGPRMLSHLSVLRSFATYDLKELRLPSRRSRVWEKKNAALPGIR
jgi:hypothetical protein